MSDTPPPLALAPESFAEKMYAAMEPLAAYDPENEWSLLILLNAVGQMYQLLEDWLRDTADGPGWTLLLDLARCPDEALPWLAQFVGVRVLPGSSPAEMRARIASTDGFKRGTRAAMEGAAAATLTGAKILHLRERSGDTAVTPEYAYYLDAFTYNSQTPDPAATQAALMSQKPGGLVLTYAAVNGQNWQLVKDTNATWQAVKTRYPTWLDVLNAEL